MERSLYKEILEAAPRLEQKAMSPITAAPKAKAPCFWESPDTPESGWAPPGISEQESQKPGTGWGDARLCSGQAVLLDVYPFRYTEWLNPSQRQTGLSPISSIIAEWLKAGWEMENVELCLQPPLYLATALIAKVLYKQWSVTAAIAINGSYCCHFIKFSVCAICADQACRWVS